jgi:drug/metabolite transporter (DMT)-like permease
MHKYKKIDFWINIVLMVIGIIFILAEYDDFGGVNDRDNIAILLPCLFWGISQSVSMIIHLFFQKKWKCKVVRYAYTIFALMVLAYSCTINFDEYNHTFFLPFMALFYVGLCGFEVFIKTTEIEKPL